MLQNDVIKCCKMMSPHSNEPATWRNCVSRRHFIKVFVLSILGHSHDATERAVWTTGTRAVPSSWIFNMKWPWNLSVPQTKHHCGVVDSEFVRVRAKTPETALTLPFSSPSSKNITSNDRSFVCPIICTGIYSPCYFVHWHLQQWLIQAHWLIEMPYLSNVAQKWKWKKLLGWRLCTLTVLFTKPPASWFPDFDWYNSCEIEKCQLAVNGLWRAFLPATGNPMAWWIVR